MFKIPNQTKKLTLVPDSDILGNLWSTFNINLTENVGRIRVSSRCPYVNNSVDLVNLETTGVFRFYDDTTNERIWAISGGRMFYSSGDPDDTWTQDATASTPTNLGDGADMELFNSSLYVVKDSGVLYKYNGSWSTVSSSLNGGDCQLVNFRNRLYGTQVDSQIFSISSGESLAESSGTPNTVDYTLDLTNSGSGGSANNHITSIRAASNRIWITTLDKTSTTHAAGRGGRVHEWDGVNPQVNKTYHLDSIGALALIIIGDIPYIVDANGKLQKFNGREFVTIAKFPLSTNEYLTNPAGNLFERFIHPRGIILQDDSILMLINGAIQGQSEARERIPSGIWEYNENNGLYHKYSLSQWKLNSGADRVTDFGQNVVAEVGALFNAKTVNTSSNGDLLFGAKYYTDNSSTAFGIFMNDANETLSKCGYFVTQKIESDALVDTWQTIVAKYRPLLNSSDRIEVKYRLTEVESVQATATWTSATTFTSTDDLSTFEVGDEVEVIRATGSGQCERITGISSNAGTYTVTLGENISGTSTISLVRLQKWVYIGTIQNQTQTFTRLPIMKPGTWIQIKCVMYFTGQNELEELTIINKPHQKFE